MSLVAPFGQCHQGLVCYFYHIHHAYLCQPPVLFCSWVWPAAGIFVPCVPALILSSEFYLVLFSFFKYVMCDALFLHRELENENMSVEGECSRHIIWNSVQWSGCSRLVSFHKWSAIWLLWRSPCEHSISSSRPLLGWRNLGKLLANVSILLLYSNYWLSPVRDVLCGTFSARVSRVPFKCCQCGPCNSLWQIKPGGISSRKRRFHEPNSACFCIMDHMRTKKTGLLLIRMYAIKYFIGGAE